MRDTRSTALWLPAVLCAMVADLNFWYWASTGENDLDYAGVAFFFLFSLYAFKRFLRDREIRDAVSGIGAVAALVMMVLRQTGTWDLGYIPPYVVFVVVHLLGGLIRLRPKVPAALLFLALGLGLSAPARAASSSGKELFGEFCSSCHGADGKGLTEKGKKLHARDLTDPVWQAGVSDKRLAESITNGHRKMRAFGRELTTREIRSLVKEVRALAAKPGGPS